MIRSILLAAGMLVVPALAHAHPYATLNVPVYTCTKGDNATAINGLLAAGGDVEIAAGKCHVSTSITLSVPGTTLNGAGTGQTIFLPTTGVDIDIITIGLASTTWGGGGFTVSNLTTNGLVITTADPNAVNGHGIHVTGGVHPITGFAFGAALTNVETKLNIGGVNITGSGVTATNLNTHDNRHSGFFVQGSARYAAPYNIADSDGMVGSSAVNNNLDNAVGSTWDNIDYSNYTANGFIGGPNAGDGNTVTGGDILFGCPPTDSKCTSHTGPFLAQGNTVTNTGAVQAIGMRAYGNVAGVTFDNNVVSTAQTGIALLGDVTNSTVSNNIITGPSAFGIELDTLSGGSPGDNNIVTTNNITVTGGPAKPAVSVIAQTNVQVLNNVGHGAPYATSQAGAWLVFTGNS